LWKLDRKSSKSHIERHHWVVRSREERRSAKIVSAEGNPPLRMQFLREGKEGLPVLEMARDPHSYVKKRHFDEGENGVK